MTKNYSYNLKERTLKFSNDIIRLCKSLPKNNITSPIISQLIRAATSIGANYCEADNAESRDDFRHKIGIAKKEANETCYWLKLLSTAIPEHNDVLDYLLNESHELHLIFNSIYNKSK